MKKRRMKKKLSISAVVFLLVLGLIGYFLIYRPYSRIRAKGEVVVASAKELKAVFKENNIDLLESKMNEFTGKYKDFEQEAQTVYWAGFIPYIADFRNGVEAGDYVIKAGNELIRSVKPYADLIGFKKGQTSFAEKSSEDRLQTAVATLDKVLGNIDTISDDIKNAETRLNAIDPNRYPENFGNKPVKSQIVNLRQQFTGYASLFVDSKPLLKKLPEIFGNDKEKTYLLLMQNDKEQRATGGFLTAYAVFKIKSGKISIVKSADIYSLDNSIGTHPPAPDKILMYHKGVSQFYIRDSNLSPDFVKSLEIFNTLYNKSSDKVQYDGVISIDTKILVDMLTIFGDTEVDGVRFSANKDARCDCPQVIYTLFDMVDRPVGYIKENRKGVLGDLMYALFYKAIGFSPSKYWGTLIQTMFKNLDEKDILLSFTDPQLQAAVEKLNYAGRIKEYDGDYLHVNNVNFAGAKSNLFVTKTLISKTTYENGKVNREITVEFRNPYPHSDCNLERGGLCLNATLRDWIRFYVPQGSQLVDFKGSEKKTLTYDDLGKTVFEGFLTVTPLGKATVTIKYTLPDTVNKNNYKILIQKQPGEQTEKLQVDIDGKKVYDGALDKDKELKAQ